MDEAQARDLAERFRSANGVTELQGVEARDFVFVDKREILLGSFRVDAPNLPRIFVSIVSSNGPSRTVFQLFVMEKMKGSPMASFSRVQDDSFVWRYAPTKQSGDNVQRKKAFENLAGAPALLVPLPASDISPFASAVAHLLALRHQADAARGDAADDPTEGELDPAGDEGPAYWKVAPGEVGSAWERCKEEGLIAIGWNELGDLTGLDEAEFNELAARTIKEHGWGAGASQAFKFRNIAIGDRIVANAGTKTVLGIGTVTGPYRFDGSAERFGHRLPVRWDDTTARAVSQPGWRRTLIRLTESTFSKIAKAPAAATGESLPPAAEVAKPAGGIDFEGVLAQLESNSLAFPAELVASYLLALQTRRFVLLTGISGTGKTQLALEVARLFSPRVADGISDGVEKVIAPDMLKRGRFVVPAQLAKDFDALGGEERRIDVRLLGRATESMAVYKDPARPSLLIVLLSGEGKRAFQTELSPGDRLSLRRETIDDSEVLVVERAATPSTILVPAYELVAVRPDWTDSRALLGFYNPLTRSYFSTPTLELVLRAQEEAILAAAEGRAARPFFLIFDEMNLARVEHYFSDFLSAMESGEELVLHDDDEVDEEIPRRLSLPMNLFVVGTVNIDETTYLFSPKVLDRAFLLEFNEVDLDLLSGNGSSEDQTSTPLALSRLSGGLKLFGRATDEEWIRFEQLCEGRLRKTLIAIHAALANENRHFGYRVAREIARFAVLAAEQTSATDEALLVAFDIAVLAKVLPKLNGTHAELDAVLRRVFGVALGTDVEHGHELDSWRVVKGVLRSSNGQIPLLPRTATKLWRMQKRVRANGFVSFIE